MNISANESKKVLELFNVKNTAEYVQYIHRGNCEHPCPDCISNNLRIFDNDKKKPPVGEANHPHCDCYYTDVQTKAIGSISQKGNESPDVYLKLYGHLPDYYITKEEAINKYGWDSSKNTLSGKAPGFMIGGDVFKNRDKLLPVKTGRVWYECDIDYISGKRNSKRLYYSNDGLMFFSPDHYQGTFYYLK